MSFDLGDKDLIEHIVARTVRHTLTELGIDLRNPLEMQSDFQYLRQWRKAGDEIRRKGRVGAMSFFVSGAIALILLGVKVWLGKEIG